MTHRSRFLRSDTYEANMAANRIVVSEMGTMAYPDPSKNFIVKYAPLTHPNPTLIILQSSNSLIEFM